MDNVHRLGCYQYLEAMEAYRLLSSNLAHETKKMLRHNEEKNQECEEAMKALKEKLDTSKSKYNKVGVSFKDSCA